MSIASGKMADAVILNDSLLTDEMENIEEIKVKRTNIGGKIVWAAATEVIIWAESKVSVFVIFKL